ncbi:hypothetical protein J4219_06900 [Candidatus Woesearchaeota archaeon]|nr:hypothetical protein [Candidatus Woesearchaeota archaeon]
MNKWLKIIPISLLVFIVSLYVFHFMPLIKSNCGCAGPGSDPVVKRVPLNYFFGCFCSMMPVQADDFPQSLKSNFAQRTLAILPVLFAGITILLLRKRFN